jgi:hypothetical protein
MLQIYYNFVNLINNSITPQGFKMKYALITPNGAKLEFHTKAAAELFKQMHGGYVVRISDELKLAA